jgi:chaperonin GroES
MFRPILDNVLIEDLEENKMSKGGIHLPIKEQQRFLQGVVVAVGPGHTTSDGVFVPTQIKVGEKLAYEPFKAKKVEIDGKVQWIVRERDVVCTWE